MESNNYTHNENGTSISFNIIKDVFLGQDAFSENITEFSDSLHQYIDNGNIGKLETRDLITVDLSNSKPKLLEALEYFGGEDFDDKDTKEELIKRLYSLPVGELLSRSWLNRKGVSELLSVTENYEMVTVTGYSQGSVADVIVPHALKDVWGSTMDELKSDSLKKELHHYFYDQPYRGIITVNDEEYDIAEYMDDAYVWDKASLIENLSTYLSDEAKKELDEILPEYMDGNDCVQLARKRNAKARNESAYKGSSPTPKV